MPLRPESSCQAMNSRRPKAKPTTTERCWMTIVRAKNPVEAYRARAIAGERQGLTGRGNKIFETDFVAENILKIIDVSPGMVVVDVGCGDATLLRKIDSTVSECNLIGVLPTQEEVNNIHQYLLTSFGVKDDRINILEGLAERIPLPSASADVLVCNSVLHLAGRSKAEAHIALLEFLRIVKSGGKIYIGELPEKDEFEGETYGSDLIGHLVGVWRHQGFSKLIRNIGQILRAAFSKKPYIYGLQGNYFSPPEEFVKLAESMGCKSTYCGRHLRINKRGVVRESPTRWNYLFEKL